MRVVASEPSILDALGRPAVPNFALLASPGLSQPHFWPHPSNWGRRNARSDPPPHGRWRRVLDSQSTWLCQISANICEAHLIIFEGPGLDLALPPLYLSAGLCTFRRAEREVIVSIFLQNRSQIHQKSIPNLSEIVSEALRSDTEIGSK